MEDIIENEYGILGKKILEYCEECPVEHFSKWSKEVAAGIKTKEEVFVNDVVGLDTICEMDILDYMPNNHEDAMSILQLAFDESISDKEYRNMLKKYIIKLGTGIENYEGRIYKAESNWLDEIDRIIWGDK